MDEKLSKKLVEATIRSTWRGIEPGVDVGSIDFFEKPVRQNGKHYDVVVGRAIDMGVEIEVQRIRDTAADKAIKEKKAPTPIADISIETPHTRSIRELLGE